MRYLETGTGIMGRMLKAAVTLAVLGACVAACSGASEGTAAPTSLSGPPSYEPPILQDSMSGRISALTSPACPTAFARSVHPNYYTQGTGRCVVFERTSVTAGIVKASMQWPDNRVDT
jgi:hypothetical protein